MKLTIIERILAFNMLPEKGSFMNLKLIREAREKLSFTESEIKKFKIVTHPNGQINWDGEKDKGVEVELSESATAIIKKVLIDLNKKESLEQKHFTLYEKFVGEE